MLYVLYFVSFCILACVYTARGVYGSCPTRRRTFWQKKCAIKWRKHDSIRRDFRFKAWALVTAYEQQDSCGVYHAVQCNNLCHMLTWAWRGKEISMLIQRVRSVRLCSVSEASVTVICPPPTHERNQVILPFMHSVLLKCRNSYCLYSDRNLKEILIYCLSVVICLKFLRQEYIL